MALITRQSKDSKLTIEEMDGNLTYLEELAQGGTGITSSFQVGFSEFIIENGLITQENDIWTYDGVLKVGIDTGKGAGNYMYGYIPGSGFGGIVPTSNQPDIYWSETNQALVISKIETIGKVIIDEGEASELILEASDFNVSYGMATSGVISNPFPVESGTHTIKIQYTNLQTMENLL